MLSDRCPVCLSVLSSLSVTLVYCGQTVGWIKMKLGTQLGLGPGHIALDKEHSSPTPLSKFTAAGFACETVGRIRMPLGREVGLGLGDIVLDGDPAPPPRRGTALPPTISVHIYCGKTVAHLSYC